MKKYIKIISIILVVASVLTLASCGKKDENTLKLRENCGPFGNLNYAGTYEDFESLFYETEEAAKTAGVPEGFKDSVVKITGTKESGFKADYSDYNLGAGSIKSVTVRFWAPAEARKLWVRCGTNKICEFVIHTKERSKWVEFTAEFDGEFVRTGHSFEQFASDKSGLLKKFDVSMDFVSNEPVEAYIDSVTFTLKEYADSVPPVITYDAPTEIDMTAGKPIEIGKISAYDKFDDRETQVTFEWENAEAADENGYPKEGKHKYYAVTRDMDLNEARVEFNVNVRPRDTEAPVINVDCSELTVSKDAVFDMHFTATDNEDGLIIAEAVFEEKGAIDFGGHVSEGTHKLTITAKDFTGNVSEKTITVISK